MFGGRAGGGLTSAVYETNALDQYAVIDGAVQSFDLNGNLTGDGAASLVFSSENRLLSYDTASQQTAYAYGPNGLRVAKTVANARTEFLHAGNPGSGAGTGMEIAEYDGAGALTRRYIPGPGVDQRIAMVTCSGSSSCAPGDAGVTTHAYFADRLGNVIAVLDTATGSMERYVYTPFGVRVGADGDASGNPFRYTGRRFEPEIGGYYYRARYYDPDTG